MGFLDDAGNLFNKGVASAGRTTRSISLKSQINDLNKRRETIMAQIGANLYEETRIDPKFRAPNEELYASVESLDQQKASLQEELANLETQAQAPAQPADQQPIQPPVVEAQPMVACPTCGKMLSVNDAFCSGCGSSITKG